MRPGHIQVFDGLRITTEHLEHFQGSLHSAIQDLRVILGLGRVHSGFEVMAGEGDRFTVQPGLAFDFRKNRVVLDEPKTVQVTFGPEQHAAYVCAKYDQIEDGETEGRSTLIWEEAVVEVLSAPPTEQDNVVPLAKVVRAPDGSLHAMRCDEPLCRDADPTALQHNVPVVRQGVVRLPPDPASGSCSATALATQWRAARAANEADVDTQVVDLSTANLALGLLVQSLTCYLTLSVMVEPVNGSAKALRCSAVGEVTCDGKDIAQFGASTFEGATQLSEQEIACLPLESPALDAGQSLHFSVRVVNVTDARAQIVCSLRCADASESLLRAIEEQWARLTWDVHLGWKVLGTLVSTAGREPAAPVD